MTTVEIEEMNERKAEEWSRELDSALAGDPEYKKKFEYAMRHFESVLEASKEYYMGIRSDDQYSRQ